MSANTSSISDTRDVYPASSVICSNDKLVQHSYHTQTQISNTKLCWLNNLCIKINNKRIYWITGLNQTLCVFVTSMIWYLLYSKICRKSLDSYHTASWCRKSLKHLTSLYDDIKRSAASAADKSRLRAVVNAWVRLLIALSAAPSLKTRQ